MIWWYWMLLGSGAPRGRDDDTRRFLYSLLRPLGPVVGTLAGLDLVHTDWLQWLLFSVIAVGSLLRLARTAAGEESRQDSPAMPDVDSMAGELAIPLEPLAVGATGKAELRGTTWTAKNVGATPLGKGQRGKVTRKSTD